MSQEHSLIRERISLPMGERMIIVESEIGRLQSDYESEKGSRARTNSKIFEELGKMQERIQIIQIRIAIFIGGLSTVTWLIQLLKH